MTDPSFEVEYDEPYGLFISYCPSLDLYGQGLSAEEALEAVEDGATRMLEHLARRGLRPSIFA